MAREIDNSYTYTYIYIHTCICAYIQQSVWGKPLGRGERFVAREIDNIEKQIDYVSTIMCEYVDVCVY